MPRSWRSGQTAPGGAREWTWRAATMPAAAGSEEWQLEDANLREVLRWADNDETHRPYTLYACCTCGGELGLNRLTGSDPTATA
jgi:hypothetical protein